MNRPDTEPLSLLDDFGPDYHTWNEPTRIMFLEKRILLLRKQMIRQECLADSHRRLLSSIHEEYEAALEQLRDKHNELKKMSRELDRARKNLEQKVSRRTRELEKKNTALEERTRQLERSKIALDVLLKRCRSNEKSAARQVKNQLMTEILPALEKLCLDLPDAQLKARAGQIIEKIMNQLQGTNNSDFLNLSDREAMVAGLISQGRTCREAADILGLSLRGVQSHCYNIRKKLGLSGKVRLKDYLRTLPE